MTNLHTLFSVCLCLHLVWFRSPHPSTSSPSFFSYIVHSNLCCSYLNRGHRPDCLIGSKGEKERSQSFTNQSILLFAVPYVIFLYMLNDLLHAICIDNSEITSTKQWERERERESRTKEMVGELNQSDD